MLLSLGFKPYLDDPALYTNNYIVIIVFVDDFLATYYKSKSLYA
jgi:hypothetical protein